MFEKCQCEYPDDQYDLAMDETPSIGDVQRTIVQVDYSSKLSPLEVLCQLLHSHLVHKMICYTNLYMLLFLRANNIYLYPPLKF
jgi:hypothetical protein